MKIYKALVKQCASKDYWYKDLIGKEVNVVSVSLPHEFSRFTYENIAEKAYALKAFFHEDDLQILEEFEGEVVVCNKIIRKDNETTQS